MKYHFNRGDSQILWRWWT